MKKTGDRCGRCSGWLFSIFIALLFIGSSVFVPLGIGTPAGFDDGETQTVVPPENVDEEWDSDTQDDSTDPEASFTINPNPAYTGETVYFTDTSDPHGGMIIQWYWDFGDGHTQTIQYPPYISGDTTHIYTESGTYTVYLQIRNAADVTDSYQEVIIITNSPPTADAGGPYATDVGEALSFDGTGSSDPDGTITSYEWDFGDGNTATGPTPSHTYLVSGDYPVVLTVIDDDGDSDSDSTLASVNSPPVADAGGPYNAEVGEDLQLDGSGSADSDGSITGYDWDFGDGNTGVGVSPSHTYSGEGEFTVTLTVIDDAGSVDTASSSVSVVNPDVVVDAGGPYAAQTGELIVFSGSASEGKPPYTFSWDFGDGNTSDEQNPEYIYVNPGTFTVTLMVVDRNGDSGWDATTALVDPEPLLVELPESLMERVDTPVSFTADVSGGVPPYSFVWCFGDGNTSSEQNPTYVYSSTGEYTVDLSVVDDMGEEAVASMVVNIVDAVADLECTGSLSWTGINPGDTVSGSFMVSNCGDSGSVLDWMIVESPGWGSWSCTPDSGTGLSAGEDLVVNVSVVVPDEKMSEFNGNLTVMNLGDDTDQERIPVLVSTPKSGVRSAWSVLVEWLQFWFPFFSFL